MVFKNFRINIIARLAVVTVVIFLFVFCLYQELYLRSVYVLIALVILLIELFRFIDKTNVDYSNFLLAISQNDFTTTYSEKNRGKTFNTLYSTFNQLTEKYRSIGEEKEAQLIFLSLLVEHIRVGIISFDGNGNIHLLNQAMRNFLHNKNINNLADLSGKDEEIQQLFHKIKTGENVLIKTISENKVIPLTIQAAEITLRGKLFKLVSAQDIRNELDVNELEAWQKLIRVLTHEIMNSVSPIISLSSTLAQLVGNTSSQKTPDNSELNTLRQGLEAIVARSNGLKNFTDSYRSLTKLPQPQFRTIKLHSLIDHVELLFKKEIIDNNLSFQVSIDPELEVYVDPDLFEQVLINLMRNAVDALAQTSEPRIEISANGKTGQVKLITIKDNGPGIPPDQIDKVFIPFYTTKKSGTGIGLPLSKQIIQLHGGTLFLSSGTEGCVVEILL